jgi:hypothetical protein
MADRSEPWIAALVLFTSGLVLAAPVLGRIGLAAAADVAMALAAACGFGESTSRIRVLAVIRASAAVMCRIGPPIRVERSGAYRRSTATSPGPCPAKAPYPASGASAGGQRDRWARVTSASRSLSSNGLAR